MRHSFGKENREAEGLKVPYAKLVQECFSYTEQSEKKFRSLRVLTEAAFQILFGGSLSSLSPSAEKLLFSFIVLPFVEEFWVKNCILHHFLFLHTRFDSYRICRTFSNMISFWGTPDGASTVNNFSQ